MKSATLPSLRVEPELRDSAERVLEEGETLSAMIETAVREMIERRRARAEFIERGLASREESQRTLKYYTAAAVHEDLRRMLDRRRKRLKT